GDLARIALPEVGHLGRFPRSAPSRETLGEAVVAARQRKAVAGAFDERGDLFAVCVVGNLLDLDLVEVLREIALLQPIDGLEQLLELRLISDLGAEPPMVA